MSLPRKQPTPQLGASRDAAVKRYNSNQRSHKRKGTWDIYRRAVDDYHNLDHAEVVPHSDIGKPVTDVYYLPMHGITKNSSTTTKLCVVCDASARTTTGVSLNDTLLVGPSLYPRLTTIVNQFRVPAIGMTADILKMYLQVALSPDERDFHRFVHQDEAGQLKDWRMKRLTFGVSSSPFLATQVMRQVAVDHQSDHPLAAEIVNKSFYVDDVLTGSDDLSTAKRIREDLTELTGRACMKLCKWRTSSPQLRDSIPEELRELTNLSISLAPSECPKTLGLHWDTNKDCFFVPTPEVQEQPRVTKRVLASVVATIFDVLGWFSPATLTAKMLLQETWSLKIDWDHPLPDFLHQKWNVWIRELPEIMNCPVPRHLGLMNVPVIDRQLHGFCDASIKAYGGVIYLRTFHANTNVTINLISSKSKVAPLKSSTVPRLELCGAVVLAELLETTAKDLDIPMSAVYAWSDSAVVLGWLQKHPSRLCVYVANRVTKIASLINPSQWRYVTTLLNPADLLSRGVLPTQLAETQLWWNGPPWLALQPAQWPRRPI